MQPLVSGINPSSKPPLLRLEDYISHLRMLCPFSDEHMTDEQAVWFNQVASIRICLPQEAAACLWVDRRIKSLGIASGRLDRHVLLSDLTGPFCFGLCTHFFTHFFRFTFFLFFPILCRLIGREVLLTWLYGGWFTGTGVWIR